MSARYSERRWRGLLDGNGRPLPANGADEAVVQDPVHPCVEIRARDEAFAAGQRTGDLSCTRSSASLLLWVRPRACTRRRGSSAAKSLSKDSRMRSICNTCAVAGTKSELFTGPQYSFARRRPAVRPDRMPSLHITSGTGADGSVGLRAVKVKGGFVVAQDPHEAGHAGMPQSAIMTGEVDLVLPAPLPVDWRPAGASRRRCRKAAAWLTYSCSTSIPPTKA